MSVSRHSTRRSKFTQPPLPETIAKALEKLQQEQFREEQRLARAMRVMKRSYIVCPGCLEHLPRDGSTILLHSRSGCGEIIAIQKLWGVIKRERQASPQGPDWIPAKSLLAEIERAIGKPDWAVEAAIDDLTLDMEDVALGGPSGSK